MVVYVCGTDGADGGEWGLAGVYRVSFWNRGSGVTLLGRPGGCGGGLKSRTSDGGRVGVIDRSALRYWAGRVEFIKRAYPGSMIYDEGADCICRRMS